MPLDIRRRMVTLPAVTAAVCKTEDAFNDDEIAGAATFGKFAARSSLAARGACRLCFSRTDWLFAPRRKPANMRVRYLCPDLFREVYGRGDGAKIEALCDEMEAVYLRFIKLRAARLVADE